MATTASSTPSAGDHLVNSMPLNLNAASCSSSSTKSNSLFDRVANFRRSLIKSQHKKNKIRPSSGTFNFFKPTSSSNLTEANTATNGAKNGAFQHSSSITSGQFDSCESSSVAKNGHHLLGASSAASASNLRHSIIVDEEDAIYGFTSLHLNNQTSLRRQLNRQQQQQQQSSDSNGHCSIRRTNTSSSSPSQLFTSSSCISLYETIDEVEPISGPVSSGSSSGGSSTDSKAQPPPPPLPPSNPKSHFQTNYSKLRSANSHSTRQLRMSSIHDTDWKRNRRSSAIIFGSDFHDLMIDDSDEPTSLVGPPPSGPVYGHPPNGYHHRHPQPGSQHHPSPVNSATVANGTNHSMQAHSLHLHHQLNRSSDDLLLMAHRTSHHYFSQFHQEASTATNAGIGHCESARPFANGNSNVSSRIYENLLNGGQPQQQHSNHKRSDNRKLTKDSGYESASTLVSLTQLNGCTGAPCQSSPLPPVQQAAGITPSHKQHYHHNGGQLISPMGNLLHCRSDSIDSANSLCGDLQSPSPPVPKCLPSSQSESPPLPPPPEGIEALDDLRPPTPPVRYSSLPQNRSFLHRHHRQVPPPPPPSVPTASSADHNGTIALNASSMWQQQMQSSFNSFDHHQLDRLSTKQLRGLAHHNSSASNLMSTESQPVEYHHAKQDSWPISFVSSSTRSGCSSASSPSTSQRRHTTKSMLASDLPPATSIAISRPPLQAAYQRQQSYPAKPYAVFNGAPSNGASTAMTQSPSLSSLSNTIANSTSVRHSIASCSTSALAAASTNGYHANNNNNNNNNYQPTPAHQIAHSHRVHQVPRQELCMPAPKHRVSLETSLDDILCDVAPEPCNSISPPPLPPKNVVTSASSSPGSHLPNGFTTPRSGSTGDLNKPRPKSSPEQSFGTNEIKAIQKRAVYEFYLRQKEKKEKAKRSSPPDSPRRSNSGSSSGSASSTATPPIGGESTQSKSHSHSEHEDDGIIEEEELLPLPTPPPPLATDASATNSSTTSAPNRFFVECLQEQSSPLAEAFPPPPTPVASESPPFPSPPTPLNITTSMPACESPVSPAFPPPPTPIACVAPAANCSEQATVKPPTKQMYHSIDLSTLWPTIDFSRLLQPLPMPPPVKESNLDEEDGDDDEELASIEANRERQQAHGWRMSQLEAEQRRIDKELERNEQIIGELVRNRLAAEDTLAVDRNKLELLCKDMIMITRLMTSIVQQLTRSDEQWKAKKVLSGKSAAVSSPTATTSLTIKTKDGADSNGTSSRDANDVVNNCGDGVHCFDGAPATTAGGMDAAEAVTASDLCQQKRIRLLSQLEEAKRLRDSIETRRTMLEQRLARKCAAKNSSARTTATNQPSMLLITGSEANGADGYQLVASPLAATAPTGPLPSGDIDLTSLIHFYLTKKEHLLVQREIARLLHVDLLTRIESPSASEAALN